jgi:hypothetical protein
MAPQRSIHPDFADLLAFKDPELIELFKDLRSFIIEIHPDTNELLYHTHALTAVFSTSEKMSDGYCLIPIYSKHMNLGFSRGTLIDDKHKLLIGTGKYMRHLPIKNTSDYRNDKVRDLVISAIAFAHEDMDKPVDATGKTISKIKVNK